MAIRMIRSGPFLPQTVFALLNQQSAGSFQNIETRMKKPESQAAQEKTVVDKPIKPINTVKSSGLSEIGTRLSAKTETRTIADFLSEIDELNNADNASK